MPLNKAMKSAIKRYGLGRANSACLYGGVMCPSYPQLVDTLYS